MLSLCEKVVWGRRDALANELYIYGRRDALADKLHVYNGRDALAGNHRDALVGYIAQNDRRGALAYLARLRDALVYKF